MWGRSPLYSTAAHAVEKHSPPHCCTCSREEFSTLLHMKQRRVPYSTALEAEQSALLHCTWSMKGRRVLYSAAHEAEKSTLLHCT